MVTKAEIERRVNDFVLLCRHHGIKATHQRIEILRELAGSEEHPNADTIYKRIKKRIPAISLDTVYRTLRLLEEKEIITRVGLLQERDRFDANRRRHQHFVCSECGLIRDFYSETFTQLQTPPEVAKMGLVDNVYIELRGRCKQCCDKSKKAYQFKI